MLAQEVYDTITTHLRKQGHKSLLQNQLVSHLSGKTVICAYRGAGEDKCAAGILIGNDDYKQTMEGISWYDVCRWLSNASELREHEDLIISMQNIHDNYEVDHWEAMFNKVAIKYELTYTPPQATP